MNRPPPRSAARMVRPLAMLFRSLLLLALCSAATAGPARPGSLGQFQAHADVGGPTHPGDAVYDAPTDRYDLKGGGANMFGAHDEFHFLWRKLTGDFLVRTRLELTGPGAE